jgi:hypothetical protein
MILSNESLDNFSSLIWEHHHDDMNGVVETWILPSLPTSKLVTILIHPTTVAIRMAEPTTVSI